MRTTRVIAIFAIIFILLFIGNTNFYVQALSHNTAKSMITIEQSTGRILYEKNAYEKLPMASTTKIVTAITVIEHCKNLDESFVIPNQAIGVEGSSIYLEKGEKLTYRQLLYGLMLRSGNDCATALAIKIGGNMQNFCTLMNELAKKIGATNSNFVNSHGLHHNNHYTTAFDLAKITAYAMNNAVFREIVSTKEYNIPWDTRDYDRKMTNKNKILFSYDGGNGVKTGYTKDAGRCLVASAKRNNMQIISVVLNCGPMFEECKYWMDKAFNEYKMVEVLPKNKEIFRTIILDAKNPSIGLICRKSHYFPLKSNEKQCIMTDIVLNDNLKAPIDKNKNVGVIRILLDKQLLFSEKLYTIIDVA